MVKLSRAVGLGFVICLLAAHPVFAIELDPGLWQDTETGEEDGKPVEPDVTTDCMTPEEAKDPIKSLTAMQGAAGQCKKLEINQKGNVVSIEMQCGDPNDMAIDMTGSYTFLDRRHYTGTMKTKMTVAGHESTADKKVDSKWIGECKDEQK
jgi:hypothetical protein